MEVVLKRALVTGATGFVGSNLARALSERGWEVHALVRPGGDRGRVADLIPRLRLHEGDVRDLASLRAAVVGARPSAMIHAAICGVHPDRRERGEMVATNVVGASHVIACAREAGVERLVVTGGSSEYGDKAAPMAETDLPEPTTLYGATKAAATVLFEQAARESGLPVVVLRLFSVYGYGEGDHRLIPTAVRAALRGEELILTGSGWRRDFVFVEDVAEACLKALELDGHHGEVINVGSGRQASNEEVVEIVDRLTGGGLRVARGAYPPRPGDTRFRVADVAKAERVLGWKPRHSLEEGLRKTVAWWRGSFGRAAQENGRPA